eukprot:g2197.t1
MRNLPSYLRATCPQPISNSSAFGRSMCLSHNCRFDDSFEMKSSESSLHGDISVSVSSLKGNSTAATAAAATNTRPLFGMDFPNEDVESSSVQSRESIHVIFENTKPMTETQYSGVTTEPLLYELKSSGPVNIPPGQLTRSFADLMGKESSTDVARSAPVPVPRRQSNSINTEQEILNSPPYNAATAADRDDDGFVPPHIFLSRRSLQDPTRNGITSTSRGLSSLRIRNAVLEKVGYFDGYTELSQKPEFEKATTLTQQRAKSTTGFGNCPVLY